MRKISLLVFLAIVATACGSAAPAVTPTATNTPLPSPSPLPSLTSTPEFTSTPVSTPSETETATPATPMVEAVTQTVNCRYGPGLDYLSVGTLPPGQWVPIDASTGDQSWWRILLPKTTGTYCWIGGSLTQTSGDLSQVVVVGPPGGLAIAATVSGASLIKGPCASNANTNHFTGTITTNGPGEILYVWEIANQAGERLDKGSTQNVVFHTSGTLAVSPWSYTGGCGNYVVSLVIFNPNSLVATFSYKAVP